MKRRYIALVATVGAITILLVGPMAIRSGYSLVTPKAKLEQKIAEYRVLDRGELSLSDKALKESQMKRTRLYYWILARGRDIDGGDTPATIFTPWNDLRRYWTGFDGEYPTK